MWYPILIGALCAYFLGNLNGAVNISHLMVHEDVRAHGSGNAGLTNFARNYGGWGTALVLVVDGGKAVLACLLGGLLLAPYGLELEGRMLGAVAVSLGHDFPALLGFKGHCLRLRRRHGHRLADRAHAAGAVRPVLFHHRAGLSKLGGGGGGVHCRFHLAAPRPALGPGRRHFHGPAGPVHAPGEPEAPGEGGGEEDLPVP